MNSQFKKGVLELIVLEAVSRFDMYGYELVVEVSKVIDVNEGTIYPLLRRLTNDSFFETYLKESNEGPPRKYYHLNDKGRERLEELIKQWEEFYLSVNKYIKRSEEND